MYPYVVYYYDQSRSPPAPVQWGIWSWSFVDGSPSLWFLQSKTMCRSLYTLNTPTSSWIRLGLPQFESPTPVYPHRLSSQPKRVIRYQWCLACQPESNHRSNVGISCFIQARKQLQVAQTRVSKVHRGWRACTVIFKMAILVCDQSKFLIFPPGVMYS